jgi:hypothetical protein
MNVGYLLVCNCLVIRGFVRATILDGEKGNKYALFNKVEINLRTIKSVFYNYVFDGIYFSWFPGLYTSDQSSDF